MQPLGATKSLAQSTSLEAIKITSIEERSKQTRRSILSKKKCTTCTTKPSDFILKQRVYEAQQGNERNKETKAEELITKERERRLE